VIDEVVTVLPHDGKLVVDEKGVDVDNRVDKLEVIDSRISKLDESDKEIDILVEIDKGIDGLDEIDRQIDKWEDKGV